MQQARGRSIDRVLGPSCVAGSLPHTPREWEKEKEEEEKGLLAARRHQKCQGPRP